MSGGASRRLVMGSLVAGVATYGYQVLGVRGLGVVEYAPVSVLWTVQYLVFSVLLFPLEGLIASGGAHAVKRATLWTCGVAVVTGAVLLLLGDRLAGSRPLLGVTGALIVLSYGAFTMARGRLARVGASGRYALLTGGEALVRLVLTVPVLILVPTPAAIALLLPVGPPLVLLFMAGSRLPPLPTGTGVPDGHPSSGHLAASALANAGAQGLLATGPLLVPALGGAAADVTLAFVLLTAARLPVFLALGGLVSQQLPVVLALRGSRDAAGLVLRLRVTLACGAAAGLAAGLLGAAAGPSALAVLFGEDLRPPAAVTGCVCASVVMTAAAMAVNQLLSVVGFSGRLVAIWVAATAAGLAATSLASAAPLERLAAGLLVTQLCAAVLLTAGVTQLRVERRLLASGARTGR